MHSTLALCALLSQQLVVPPAPVRRAPPREITVEAGKLDRQGTMVGIELGAGDPKRRLTLRDDKGRVVPFQVDARGIGAFQVTMKAGSRAVYRLTEDEKPGPLPRPQVTVDTKVPNVLKILVNGKRVMEFQGNKLAPKGIPDDLLKNGFINPIFSPAGSILTEAYPQDQPRHVGLWSFFRVVESRNQKVDFWSKPNDGRIQMESIGPSWEGPVHGGFQASQIFTGLKNPFQGATLVHERWRVTVYGGLAQHPRYFLFDLESELTTPETTQVQLAKDQAGGLAIRGRYEWGRTPAGLQQLTSGSASDTHVRWAYLGGKEQGKVAGIAILGHPSNPGAPLPLGKGDGRTQPLLNLALNGDEAVGIPPHVPVIGRYRIVALDGPADKALLEALWQDMADPPAISLRMAEPKPAKASAPKQ